MQTKLLSILSVLLIFAGELKPAFVYDPDVDLLMKQPDGSQLPIVINDDLFSLNNEGATFFLSMKVPTTGALIGKKTGNGNLTALEPGDSVRFVFSGSTIEMGEKVATNAGQIQTALDLENDEGDQSTLYEFIRLAEWVHPELDVPQVWTGLFGNGSLFVEVAQTFYDGNQSILQDPDNSFSELAFNPEESAAIKTDLVERVSNLYIKPIYCYQLKSMLDHFASIIDDTIGGAEVDLEDALDLSEYKPTMDRDSFMSGFNDMLKTGMAFNLAVSASLFNIKHEYGSGLLLPKQVGEEHSQDQEDERMSATRDLVFSYLLIKASELLGGNSNTSKQSADIQKEMIKLRDVMKTKEMDSDSAIDGAQMKLQKFFNNTLTPTNVEILFWMTQFKPQIYAYIDKYLSVMGGTSYINQMFFEGEELSYAKVISVMRYANPNAYSQSITKFYLFKEARRNLILL